MSNEMMIIIIVMLLFLIVFILIFYKFQSSTLKMINEIDKNHHNEMNDMHSKINNEVNHAYIMKLALKYIDSKIPKPETPKYEQISIFDDGSTL